jgi:hypothetical protein
MPSEPAPDHSGLVVDPLQHLDPELGGSGANHGVGLLGNDQQIDPGRPQSLDAEPVSPAHPHGLAAVLVDRREVVGVHAVEVGDHDVDVDVGRLLSSDHGRERVRQDQLVLVVDLDRGQLRHHNGRGTAEETMHALAETCSRHDVERAGLAVVGFAILTPRPVARIVILAADQERQLSRRPLGGAPEELVRRHGGEGGIRCTSQDQLGASIQVAGTDEGAGALHECQHIRHLAGAAELVQRVQESRLGEAESPARAGGRTITEAPASSATLAISASSVLT